MAMALQSAPNVSVLRIIEENHNKFKADPDYLQGLKTLDHQKLRGATDGLKERIASFVNYYVLFRNMTSIKLTRGSLSVEAEKNLVNRAQDAANTYRQISSSISTIEGVTAASGFSKALDRHMPSLCQYLPYNPNVLSMIHEIKDMGITEAEISCVSEELRKQNYNLLRYGGADGTFAGFARLADSMNGVLAKENSMMAQHGLPTLRGAGGSTSGSSVVVPVVIAVVAGILCLITVFYA